MVDPAGRTVQEVVKKLSDAVIEDIKVSVPGRNATGIDQVRRVTSAGFSVRLVVLFFLLC